MRVTFAATAAEKSARIYGLIEGSGGFFSAPVAKAARSRMNVPFRIKGERATSQCGHQLPRAECADW
jgi:phosphoserine aminotransferase